MKINSYHPILLPRVALCTIALGLLIGSLSAQNIKIIPDDTASKSDQKKDENTIELSVFTVSAENDKGWLAQRTAVGSRTAKNAMELPASVIVLKRDMIVDLGATEISQVLRYGGTGVSQNSMYTDDVAIRGFRAGGALRDGIRLRSFKTNQMYDVERVEVLKGPSAMLLGNNDFLGGAVNIITRRPTEKRKESLELRGGEYGSIRAAANVTGPLYKSDELTALYRVTLGSAAGGTEKEVESIDQTFVGFGLLLYFGKQRNISLNYSFSHYQDNDYRYLNDVVDPSDVNWAKPHPLTKKFSPARSRDVFFPGLAIMNSAELLAKLNSSTNLRLVAARSEGHSLTRFIRGITLRADGVTVDRQNIPINLIDVTNGLQLDLINKYERMNWANEVTVGVDVSHRRNVQEQTILTPAPINMLTPDLSVDDKLPAMIVNNQKLGNPWQTSSDTYLDTISYYLHDTLKFLNGRLILVGGMRWFDNSSNGRNNVTKTISQSRNPVFPTHKYGIVVRPLPWISAYWTDSQNLYPQSGFTTAEPPVARLNQAGALNEFGLKVNRQFSEKLTIFSSLANFNLMQTNVLTDNQQGLKNSLGQLITIQSARDVVKGWEFDFGMHYEHNIGNFDVMGTYYKGQSNRALDNGPIVGSMNDALSLLVKYTRTQGSLKDATVGAGVYQRGVSRTAVNQLYLNPPAVYNAFVRYRITKRWSMQLNLDNVTDESYLIQVAGTALASRGRPFEVFLQSSYSR